jgi:mycothiol synthase
MADPSPAAIAVTERATPAEQDAIAALVHRAADSDGHQAVNEAGLLALRHGPGIAGTSHRPAVGHPAVHVLAHASGTGELVGYGQLRWENSGPVAALVVDPDHRRRGVGAALWTALTRHAPAPLRVWASGNGPGARALANRQGLRPVRTLLVLGRSLGGDLPPVDPPDGVIFRTFRPGEDERDWLTVNASAFATHPEQGSLTRTDLEQRMAEPWFDPAGLFLAVRQGRPIGFHWTKREQGSPIGEVYVIGVDPTAGVPGLGTPLLGVGLRHLRDRGATSVELYVEADNARALALYRRHGFSPVSADVLYAAPGAPAPDADAPG